MNRTTAALLFVFAVLMALVGCGGGGGGGGTTGSTGTTVTTTPVTFNVDWGARTRNLAGPSSALSATLTLTGATTSGGDLVYTANRNSTLALHTETYTTNVAAKVGSYPMTIRFYSAASGAGAVVAQGSATVTIASDGSGIGTVGVTNTVTTVAVTSGQTIPASGLLQLAFTARDASNNLVAVSAGSAKWTQVSGQSNFTLTSDGVANGTVAGGSGTVQVVVDGVTSVPTTVTVAGLPVVSVVVDAGQQVNVGATKQLTFTARDANGNVVSVPNSEAVWAPPSGSQDPDITISTTGVATGIRTGTAPVQVTVRGVTSSGLDSVECIP